MSTSHASPVQAQCIREFEAREPEADGTVITWGTTLLGGGGEYSYVAIKRGHLWYVTGKWTTGLTWLNLRSQYKALREGRFWVAGRWDYQGEG